MLAAISLRQLIAVAALTYLVIVGAVWLEGKYAMRLTQPIQEPCKQEALCTATQSL